jgi:hypothetical protein
VDAVDAGGFAFGAGAVFASVVGVFDDVVEEDGGGAGLGDGCGDCPPECFDVGVAVGVEAVEVEDGVERVDDEHPDALVVDERLELADLVGVEHFGGFDVVEAVVDLGVCDAEEFEALEHGAGAHCVEVDPADGFAGVEFGFGEDEREPRFHAFGFA